MAGGEPVVISYPHATTQDDLEWEGTAVAGCVAAAAAHAYELLHENGFVHLLLQPGDMTRYNIVIVGGPAGSLLEYSYVDGVDVRPTNIAYIVTLAGFGDTYVWDARRRVHTSYVKDKWAKGDHYTGRLLAWFLNHLHALIMGESLP